MSSQLLAVIRNGKIEPLEPINFPEGTQLVVTISSSSEVVGDSEDWYALSLQGLSRAYGNDEPDYDLSQIKEFNPSHERK
jgi:predicted DNA-binding antitoxin AbrB/MazE fold protein